LPADKKKQMQLRTRPTTFFSWNWYRHNGDTKFLSGCRCDRCVKTRSSSRNPEKIL